MGERGEDKVKSLTRSLQRNSAVFFLKDHANKKFIRVGDYRCLVSAGKFQRSKTNCCTVSRFTRSGKTNSETAS